MAYSVAACKFRLRSLKYSDAGRFSSFCNVFSQSMSHVELIMVHEVLDQIPEEREGLQPVVSHGISQSAHRAMINT